MLEPEVESRSWDEQLALDDASYRSQLAYLFERSAFYRRKFGEAELESASDAGGLADIAGLPLTEKSELKATTTSEDPIGTHMCAAPEEIVRIFSTSGTTGAPSFIPLTSRDLDDWVTGSARSYAASGIAAGQRIVSTYNAGPFVAGAALASFDRIGLCHIPIGTGNTERLLHAIRLLRPEAAVLTPSYAAHLLDAAAERGVDLRECSIERVLVAGEPGGGEPAFRARLEAGWGARVTEAMGIGDVGISLWGECEEQDGMHLGARGFVFPELIDPGSGESRPMSEGASGELVLTHLRHQAVPLVRFRTRDHVEVRTSSCACGRTAPARALRRPHRRHAHRARRERLPDGDPRRRRSLRAEGERPRPGPASSARREAGAAASRRGRARPWSRIGPGFRGGDPCETARRARRADACGARAVGEPGAKRVQVEARGSVTSSMRKLQTQGVHHITIIGANRQTAIDFWEGVLGMPFVFEQPNLDNASESHLYFDPGDGRLITVFTNEEREPDPNPTPREPGFVHHLAFSLSQATFAQAVERLDERGIQHSGVKDRGFMDSIYFEIRSAS